MTEAIGFKLIIEDDEGRKSVVPVDLGDITLGRDEACVIRFNERNVSRKHARLLRQDDGRVLIQDLDSYNGVWVNEERINEPFELHQGDLIRLGDFHLELQGGNLKARREETTQRTHIDAIQPDDPPIETTQKTEAQGVAPPPRATPPPVPSTRPVTPQILSNEPTVGLPEAPVPLNTPEPTLLGEDFDESTAVIHGHDADQDFGATNPNAISPPFAKFLCLDGRMAGEELEIRKAEVVIGRTSDNDLRINHRSISRHHIKIIVNGPQHYQLVDLQSANGTLINGETYASAELKNDDLIELGHVRLRFALPNQASWSHEEREQLRQSQGGRRALPVMQTNASLVLLLLLGTGVLAAAGTCLWAYNHYKNRQLAQVQIASDPNGPQSDASMPPPSAPPSNTPETDRLLAQARHAMILHQWKHGGVLAQQILKQAPNCEEAQTILHQCTLEQSSQAAFETANQAASARQWREAYQALQNVANTSSAAYSANTLMGQIRPGLLVAEQDAFHSAMRADNFDNAQEVIDEIAAMDAKNADLVTMRQILSEGRKRHVNQPSSKSARVLARARRDPPKTVAHSDMPTEANAAMAMAPSGYMTPNNNQPDPKSFYLAGKAALEANQIPRAVDAFNRCIGTDRTYAICYRALGIAYATAGDGTKAAQYYREYLKVDPSAEDAAEVRRLLVQYEKDLQKQSEHTPP